LLTRLTDETEDQGWKIIHTDVFRFPMGKSLLCSVVGTGMQVRLCARPDEELFAMLLWFVL
jgi:hypothetical protein